MAMSVKLTLAMSAVAVFGLGPAVSPVAHGQTAVNQVEITTDGSYRYIRSNGIPDHPTGSFPNAGNPNAIAVQGHDYRVPLIPQRTGHATAYQLSPFGVAINGVPFDPHAAEFWNRDRSSGWQYEPLSGAIDLGVDSASAHVQPDGTYHYHGIPGPLMAGRAGDAHSPLIGYAADGFPIYAVYGYADPQDAGSGVVRLQSGYRIRAGTRPDGPGGAYDGTFVQDYVYVDGFGNLDECNGRETVTPEYPGGTYAYFMTDSFPHIPRCFAGTPDQSFARGPGGPGQGPGTRPRPDGPPPDGRPPRRPPPRG